MTDYASAVKAERNRRRMNQDAFAGAAGLFRATIVDIESGRIRLSREAFRDLVRRVDKYLAEGGATS